MESSSRAAAVASRRDFTALLGLGIVFSLILTIPILALLFFLYVALWAFTASAAIASGVAVSALLAWEFFAMSHFAIAKIQIGNEGMTTTWRRLFQETYVPWKRAAKIRHVGGPLFLVGGGPPKMAFLSWMIVRRPKEFRSELVRRNMLAASIRRETPMRGRERG
jgi:membrane protein YdbS with pleckstrin-like domain